MCPAVQQCGPIIPQQQHMDSGAQRHRHRYTQDLEIWFISFLPLIPDKQAGGQAALRQTVIMPQAAGADQPSLPPLIPSSLLPPSCLPAVQFLLNRFLIPTPPSIHALDTRQNTHIHGRVPYVQTQMGTLHTHMWVQTHMHAIIHRWT